MAPGAGTRCAPEQLDEILGGLEERGVLARCVAVLSGYLGDPASPMWSRVRSRRVRAARPERRICAIR